MTIDVPKKSLLVRPYSLCRDGRVISTRGSHRYAAIGCVILIHLAGIWMFATQPQCYHLRRAGTDIGVTLLDFRLFRSRPPPTSRYYIFRLPDVVDVKEPQIVVTQETARSGANQINAMTERLAPTLDPAHVNVQPELPGTLGRVIPELALRLDILVLPDGSVFDARIVQSTGETEFDKLAVGWVKTNWRFLPAIKDGQPVEAWTTVMVHFAPIH